MRVDSHARLRLSEHPASSGEAWCADTAFAHPFALDYVNHQFSAAAPSSPVGLGMKQATVNLFADRLRAMPDLLVPVTVETVLAMPDRIAASFVHAGTHAACYLGIPSAGRRLRFISCDIFAVTDGRLSERWGMGDIAGVLAQLKG